EAGEPVPGIAPAAKQQGRHVARVIAARVARRSAPSPFRYRHAGNLATIGRQAAVIEFPTLRLTGWTAWWIWGVAHIYFLVGVPSPLLVSLRWLWEYLTYGRGARLITGVEDAD
ncbi:MAG TPA: NAD(P)/FAD-dependent oxidoreductase, partial [Gammaproteobacteria bacterium]|nr:NAD(P)/FAD-dependent oxidoreductase [Gammaproteobacteria bacterium]